ncbi:MAG: transcriptional repressor [Candidatus Levybacteria bacterium]|nr:transcriptional repressor [Candidatus Levybacteria bacterium]
MENFRIILQKVNLKVTNARLGVLELFARSQKPIDAEEIFAYLQKEGVDADRATVYRMLETFYEKGIIDRFEFQEGKFRYELAGSDHHHLICEQCGRIEDISDCGINVLEREIKEKKGFLVKRHALEFFGVCESCQQ